MRGNVSDRINSLRILTMMSSPDDMESDLNRVKEQAVKYEEMRRRNCPRNSPPKVRRQEKALLAQIKEHEAVALPAIAKA